MEPDNNEIFWEKTEYRLKSSLSKEDFLFWFNNICYLTSTKENRTLSIPSTFIKNQIEARYLSLITKTLQQVSGRSISVFLEVSRK